MKIKELFSGPEKWTKGSNAKDAAGNDTFIHSTEARCWCLNGAILKCYGADARRDIYNRATNLLNTYLVQWNDAPERTFEEVKELVNRLDI